MVVLLGRGEPYFPVDILIFKTMAGNITTAVAVCNGLTHTYPYAYSVSLGIGMYGDDKLHILHRVFETAL